MVSPIDQDISCVPQDEPYVKQGVQDQARWVSGIERTACYIGIRLVCYTVSRQEVLRGRVIVSST